MTTAHDELCWKLLPRLADGESGPDAAGLRRCDGAAFCWRVAPLTPDRAKLQRCKSIGAFAQPAYIAARGDESRQALKCWL